MGHLAVRSPSWARSHRSGGRSCRNILGFRASSRATAAAHATHTAYHWRSQRGLRHFSCSRSLPRTFICLSTYHLFSRGPIHNPRNHRENRGKDVTNPITCSNNTLGHLTNTIERAGTAASSTYTACVDRPNYHFFAALPKVAPETAGATTALAMSALAMVLLARDMKRRRPGLLLPTCSRFIGVCHLLFPRPALSRSHALTLSRSTSAPGRGEGNALTISVYQRLLAVLSLFPPFPPVQKIRVHPRSSVVKLRFWRFATYWLILSLLGTDPRLDFWTLHAQSCALPTNPSTDSVRVTYFAYDFDGHLTQVNSPEGVINYGYDLATGRLTSTCTANSYTAYDYDELGRLKHVNALKRNGAAINETTTYTYDKVGNRSTVTLPNGVVTSYGYDTLNRLTGLTNMLGGTNLLSSYTYQLHPTGRRTNALEILRTEDSTPFWLTNTLIWQFDGMYRLTNEVCVSSNNVSTYTNVFQYDQVGNRFSKAHLQNGATTTVTNLFNGNDQLLVEVTLSGNTPIETNSYAYDSNGSLIAKTNISSSSSTMLYGFDLKNKLSSVSLAGSSLTNFFLYNDSGIRVQSWSSSGSDTTLYLVDANNRTGYVQVLEELIARGASPRTSYVIGDDVLAQGAEIAEKPSYFLHDGHGSTRQLSKTNGLISSHYNYDAYGGTLDSSTSPAQTTKLYCGEQFEPLLQMYNLRARFYHPNTGRFNARDSFAGYNEDPRSLHKYAYASLDPVLATDPSGEDDTLLSLLVVAFVAAVLVAVAIFVTGCCGINDPYAGYDQSKDISRYNCAGLALRTYSNIDPAQTVKQYIWSKHGQVRDPSLPAQEGQVKLWLWEYTIHGEDASGHRLTPDYPDFHIVGGRIGKGGTDPTNVFTKNGHRPVHGPGTGPAFKPSPREPATYDNAGEATVTNAFKVRENMTETIYLLPRDYIPDIH
ncbi:MAG: hypothetical protein C5B50_05050 [Verrucomicrobia bacterium]|nr:MAG: hypothetical protein C5B50_05050 [Verrucomicrobiota bacterium]